MQFSIIQINAKSGMIGNRGDRLEMQVNQDWVPIFNLKKVQKGHRVRVASNEKSFMLNDYSVFETPEIDKVCEEEQKKIMIRCSDGSLYFIYDMS